jgi:hypothetical protein
MAELVEALRRSGLACGRALRAGADPVGSAALLLVYVDARRGAIAA